MSSNLKAYLIAQFNRNILSILSLVIAISALSYNSWRNELSEKNRNIRYAGFEIIKESAQLQLVLDSLTYNDSKNEQDGTEIEGWVKIGLIQSLSYFMSPEVMENSNNLFAIWQEHSQKLNDSKQSNHEVSLANTELVAAVRKQLGELK